jgi:hypothetical protein
VRLPLVDSVSERLVAYLPGPVLFAPGATSNAVVLAVLELRSCRTETMLSDVPPGRWT